MSEHRLQAISMTGEESRGLEGDPNETTGIGHRDISFHGWINGGDCASLPAGAALAFRGDP
jgi:hypothetical protein